MKNTNSIQGNSNKRIAISEQRTGNRKFPLWLIPNRLSLITYGLSLITYGFSQSNAQTVSMSFDGQELTVSKDSKAQLVLFTGKYFEGKNYLHWDVKNQSSDGIYIIYRSLDGTNFEVLGQKKGIGVPIAAPIAYYFQDENPCCEITYYKLVHLAKDNNTYLASEKIAVWGHALLLSQIK